MYRPYACVVRYIRAQSEIFKENIVFLACVYRISSAYLLLQFACDMVSSASTDDRVEDVRLAERALRDYRKLASGLDSS